MKLEHGKVEGQGAVGARPPRARPRSAPCRCRPAGAARGWRAGAGGGSAAGVEMGQAAGHADPDVAVACPARRHWRPRRRWASLRRARTDRAVRPASAWRLAPCPATRRPAHRSRANRCCPPPGPHGWSIWVTWPEPVGVGLEAAQAMHVPVADPDLAMAVERHGFDVVFAQAVGLAEAAPARYRRNAPGRPCRHTHSRPWRRAGPG